MTQKRITAFKDIDRDIKKIIDLFNQGNGVNGFELLETNILQHRVKFPILEKVAIQLYYHLDVQSVDSILLKLAETKHESCYPVIGKLLQLRLKTNLKHVYGLAINHIIQGDKWYCCDIISERVFGEGSLLNFEESLVLLAQMANHDNIWIQRSIGIASHYATKKGLPKVHVEQLLFLMLANGHKTQLYIKKGIGWPAKTIGRFHPDLIHKHADLIRSTKLSKWFQTKVRIGLSMAKAEPIDL